MCKTRASTYEKQQRMTGIYWCLTQETHAHICIPTHSLTRCSSTHQIHMHIMNIMHTHTPIAHTHQNNAAVPPMAGTQLSSAARYHLMCRLGAEFFRPHPKATSVRYKILFIILIPASHWMRLGIQSQRRRIRPPHWIAYYRVASISRLLKITSLFCKRAL